MSLLPKKTERKVQSADRAFLVDQAWSKQYPALLAQMTSSVYDDGSPRLLSSLLIFTEAGMWKAMLRDRDAGLCLWVSAPLPSLLFAGLEAALNDPGTEWRVDRQVQGQTAKRVKRTG